MASGATCVQRLDGSRDSAIHTKYRISLRSSSMQEPRYPLPRVILYHVSKHNPHENRLRCHAGALRAKFKFLDAFSAGGLSFGAEENALRRPPPNQRSAEACFEHSNFFKVTAPEARPGQLRPGAHRRQKGRANRCTPEAD
ncbi:hypothetical protein RYX36_009766 [Vicia faba]